MNDENKEHIEEVIDEQVTKNDDVSFEEVNEEGEIDVRSTIKKLREKIKKLEIEKQEYLVFKLCIGTRYIISDSRIGIYDAL